MRSLHTSRAMLVLGLIGALTLGLLLPVVARAHPVAPALLKLTEHADGRVAVDWKQPPRRGGRVLQPRLPERCALTREPEKRRLDGELVESWELDCGAEGLAGAEVTVDGLDIRRGEVMVFATLAEGGTARAILRSDQPTWTVPREQGPLAVFGDYLILGVEHILLGLDHLLFVLALVLLVPQLRRLVWTVTGFTVGHSVTLALAALGVVHVPSAPVEILIAASILLVAVELTRDRDDLVHRRPWLVAGGFGLLHGLGFAGALAEVGLPQGEIPLALLAFNLGIEAGQLLFVAAVLAIGWALRPWIPRMPRWLRWSPVYAIGGLSVFWILERSAGLF